MWILFPMRLYKGTESTLRASIYCRVKDHNKPDTESFNFFLYDLFVQQRFQYIKNNQN